MVTIATHILNKYLPNKTLPTYTFLFCKQTHQTLTTTVYKTGHSPLNTTISQHLVKIHLIGEQIQNISDLQSTDIIKTIPIPSKQIELVHNNVGLGALSGRDKHPVRFCWMGEVGSKTMFEH